MSKARLTRRTQIFALAAIAVVVVPLIVFGVLRSMAATQAAESAGRLFLDHLRRGRIDAAYAELSTQRRAATSKAEFRVLVEHPVFLEHEAVELRPAKEWSPGLCSYGSITAAGRAWAAELFFTQESDGAWRVHSFAVQPPAPTALGTLLEECGLRPHTLAGYVGPKIERATQPIPAH